MVAGQPPFKCTSEYQTFQRVMSVCGGQCGSGCLAFLYVHITAYRISPQAEYDFPEGFPEDAKDLVHKLIVCARCKFNPHLVFAWHEGCGFNLTYEAASTTGMNGKCIERPLALVLHADGRPLVR
jgi:hypothetical protein